MHALECIECMQLQSASANSTHALCALQDSAQLAPCSSHVLLGDNGGVAHLQSSSVPASGTLHCQCTVSVRSGLTAKIGQLSVHTCCVHFVCFYGGLQLCLPSPTALAQPQTVGNPQYPPKAPQKPLKPSEKPIISVKKPSGHVELLSKPVGVTALLRVKREHFVCVLHQRASNKDIKLYQGSSRVLCCWATSMRWAVLGC
jgi:hypothetical protein